MVMRRYSRGFTLIEVAIVLTIVGLVIGGIWLAASAVISNHKRNRVLEQITLINQNMRKIYQANPVTTGLDTQQAINMGAIPGEMVRNGNSIVHAYDGQMIIAGVGDTQYSYRLQNIPNDVCVWLGTTLGGIREGGSKMGIARMQLYSTIFDFTANGFNGITPAEASNACAPQNPVGGAVTIVLSAH